LLAAGNKIDSLPNSFVLLQNLEVLDLSLNNLNLAKETDKLRQLHKLRVLMIVFSKADPEELQNLKTALRPNVIIIDSIKDYIKIGQ
jgi:Leucine-rich repeat (LRR) protein